MKKIGLVFVLILSCGLFMGIKVIVDHIPRAKVAGASIIYIPSGKFLKYATFGYSSLMADLAYLWAIQYYSDYTIAERYDHLDHIFSIIAELDPRYLDPYEVGALIAVYEAKDPYLAFKVLDRGLEKNPDQWIFPYQAGHYAQMILRDYNLAREYYKKAMEIEGAPPITQRLYANAAFKGMDYETAWKNWLEVFKTARDERIKKIAGNHLYQVKSAMDIQMITEGLDLYKQRYGRIPKDLDQLVRRGIMETVPRDFDGNEYLYDADTGEVASRTVWWKR
jgi:tetratricopeptide (TPR) repeat protein